MTARPNLPGSGNRPQSQGFPLAEVQPSQDDDIPPAGSVPQSQARTAAHSGTKPPFDFKRLRRGDLVAGIASFLVFIAVFIPWYSFASSADSASANATFAQQQLVLAVCSGQPVICESDVPPQFSIGALDGGAGGWRYLILVVAIIIVLYVLSRTLDVVAQAIPSHWQVLIGMTALQGLLVLIAFAINPLSLLDSFGSSSWAFGAFLALIAAIAATVGAILVMQDDKKQSAASPPLSGAVRG
jgi:hypothetical protein